MLCSVGKPTMLRLVIRLLLKAVGSVVLVPPVRSSYSSGGIELETCCHDGLTETDSGSIVTNEVSEVTVISSK